MLIAFFGVQVETYADTDYFVRTDNVQNIAPKEVKVFGTTASTTPANATVQVYFEYGLNPGNFSSSTAPKNLSSLTLNDAKNSIFSETVRDVIPGFFNYFRAVRKTTFTNPEKVEYARGSIHNLVPVFENNAPEIVAVVPFNGSACEANSCTVSIPENFSRSIPVATVYTRDPDITQGLSLSIKSGNTGNAFYINAFGDVKVDDSKAIDYEKIHSFDLNIEAKDSGFPEKSDSVQLRVSITNVTDESSGEATYVPNNNNATYVMYGNVGGANRDGYIRYRDNGPTYDTDSSGPSSYVNYRYPNSSSGYYNSNYTVGSTYGFGTGESTYNSGQNQQSGQRGNVNANADATRQAIIQSIIAQIAVLQAELNERIRLGLP